MKQDDEIVRELERVNTAVKHLQRTLDQGADAAHDFTSPWGLIGLGYRIACGFWLFTFVASLIGGLIGLLVWVIAG